MKRITVAGLVLAVLCLGVSAQTAASGPYAVIEFADGDDVSVIRKGLSVSPGDVTGFKLALGDQVQTGKGTFLEIRIYPRKDTLKLSENTTLVIDKLDAGGQHSFRLIYGRMRAKVDKLTGKDSFEVRSTTTAAGVRGTDFGYDVIAARNASSASGEPMSRVYCFQGAVEVTAKVTPASARPEEKLEPIPQTYLLEAGQMVTVAKSDERVEATRTELSPEIKTFWSDLEAKQSSAAAAQSETPAKPTDAVPAVDSPKTVDAPKATEADSAPALDLSEYAIVMKAVRRKNTMILVGTLIAGTGVALQGTGAFLYYNDQPGLGLNFLAAGSMVTGVSLPVLINGLLITVPLDPR